MSAQPCGCDPEEHHQCEVHRVNVGPAPGEGVTRPVEKPSNPKDLIGTDKLPLSLVPGTTKAYLALGHLEGNLKYGLVNWREAGVKTSIYLDACERHLEKFKNGEWEDSQTLVPHLANALACLSIIVDAYESGKLNDDRPKAAPVGSVIDRFAFNVKHLRSLFGHSNPIHYFLRGPRRLGAILESHLGAPEGPSSGPDRNALRGGLPGGGPRGDHPQSGGDPDAPANAALPGMHSQGDGYGEP